MKKKLMALGMILVVMATLITGCKIRNYDSALIDINNGEDKITLGYANFAFKYDQARYDVNYGSSYGSTMWSQDLTGSGSTFADEIRDNVIDTLEEQYVIKKHADEYGVKLTDADTKAIDDATTEFINGNSSAALNALGADKDVVKEFLTDMTYVAKVEEAMIAKAKAAGEINDTTTSSTYVDNKVDEWKSKMEFKVDEDLKKQLVVDDLFSEASTNSTAASNSTK